MTFCPNCHNGTLREDCPHCGAPIPFPEQLNCLACGKPFAIVPLKRTAAGNFAHNTVPEPSPEKRKELEAKGADWHDVVTGKAPPPTQDAVPNITVPPPAGWTAEEWSKALREATGGEVDAYSALPPREPRIISDEPPAEGPRVVPTGRVLEPRAKFWTEATIEIAKGRYAQLWFCSDCDFMSSMEGKCGKCHKALVQIWQRPPQP